MKNACWCLLISVFFLTSCMDDDTDNEGIPLILVDSVYVDGVRHQSAYEYIPRSSTVDVFLSLFTTNDKSLKTFNVETSEIEEIKESTGVVDGYVRAIIVKRFEGDVQINQGDTTIWFRDHVVATRLTVRADVRVESENDTSFNLLLNLNTNNAGALERVYFRVSKKAEEE